MAQNRDAGHAFISYVTQDATVVSRLQRRLEAAGIPVWRDVNVLPGEDWRATMRHAIADNALVFVACFSTNSAQSGMSRQNEELTLAIEQIRARPPGIAWLIPVRFDDCQIPDLDIGAGRTLRSLHPADLFGADLDVETERLIASIQRILTAGIAKTQGAATFTPPYGRRPVWQRLMSWDVVIRAAWISGICVIIAALIALIANLIGSTPSGNPNTGQRTETTFTDSRTFANFANAGDPLGAPLKAGQAVKVSCRVRGFKVKDGDRWWYRLASPPWNGRYYATSDVFYNTLKTSGNPINGVRVDRRVPVC